LILLSLFRFLVIMKCAHI